jgi:putative ABC transport system permease protein
MYMSSFWQDIRYAGRSLRKAPAFTALVILILAVGIGANVAMFSVIDTTMVRSLPYEEPERLVVARATFSGRVNLFASAFDYWDYKEQSTSFEYLAAHWGFAAPQTITGGDRPERVPGLAVGIELFPMLGVRPQLGRNFTADEAEAGAPGVVIISHGLWLRRFGGEPDALGQTITINETPYTVIGVMPAGFFFFDEIDVWWPMRPDSDFVGARRFHNWMIAGKLKPGVTLAQAQSDVDVISARLEAEYPDSNRDKALLITPMQEALLEDYRASLLTLMGAVALVLLIACGNVAGLLLARGSVRRGELSVRAAMGASGVRLLRQQLTESFFIAGVAGIAGTILAGWIQTLFTQMLEIQMPGIEQAGLSGSVLLFAIAVSLLSGLLFGIVPALRGSRSDLVEDLKASGRTTDGGGTRFRGALVVAQVAITITLLVGAGLLIRSFATLRGLDPGFDPHGLLTAELRLTQSKYGEAEQRIQFYGEMVENLRANPGVEDVALISRLPIRDPGGNIYVWPTDNPPIDPADRRSAFDRNVFPGYFEAMRIPLLAGRTLNDNDVADAPPVVVISQFMADSIFPGVNPIGRQVTIDMGDGFDAEIVGIVGNVRTNALQSEWYPAFYTSYLQRPFYGMRIAVRTSVKPTSIAAPMRQTVWNLDRDIVLADIATMDDIITRSVGSQKTIAVALAGFAAVALLLATVGLYSVLAYYVSRRQNEIGIRVAMGAAASDIVELVLRRGVTLVAIGIVLGLAGAFGATRLIKELLYDTAPTDPITFVAVSLLFGLVAVGACLIPAWRALRVDPATALQAE